MEDLNYYFQVKNDKIITESNLPTEGENITNIETTEHIFENWQVEPNRYYVVDGVLYTKTDKEMEEEKEREEQERIANLTCTKRVLILMLEELGLDYFEQIEPLINANRQARLEWELCSELQRKNPLLDQIGAKLKVTPEQLDRLFKYANGEIKSLK